VDALEKALEPDRRPEASVRAFLDRLAYVPLDASTGSGFDGLAAEVGDPCKAAIFLSTAPSLFGPTIAGLAAAGLACDGARLALEKPLGHDLESSRAINDAVAAAYPESRTFRIDHVQISVGETVGLEGRADYYDGMGALRDMVQNHMLQLLALVAMEPPARYDPTAVRDEKVKVLRSLRPITAHDVTTHSVRGQYGAGAIDGQPVPAYADELGRASDTETFVALKAHVDNWRWRGVPFYLRTGKRMPERVSEIIVQFRAVPHSMFGDAGLKANKLIISIQPHEDIGLKLMAKVPGLDRDGLKLRAVPLDIGMTNAFADVRRRIAYERLLLDLVEGKQTLFVRRDEVEAQWTWIDGIRAGWAETGMGVKSYAAGNWGPSQAIALTERDGVSWHD